MNKNQLRLELDVDLQVMHYHLTHLLEEGLVLKLDSAQGKEHIYFLAEDRGLWADDRTRILYSHEAIRRTALFVAEHPRCNTQEIAAALGKSPVTVRHRLRELLDRGLVARGQIGRRVLYEPLEPLWRWTCRFGHRYSVPWRERGEAIEVDGFGDEDVLGVGEALLAHPTRLAIVETLGRRPGMNKNQLCLELDLGIKVLDSHLQKLIDEGLVLKLDSAQDKEYLYFLPENEELWENPRTRILYGREPTRNAALFIVENPGCSSTEIAEGLGVTVVTVRYHLRTLIDYEIIVSARVGRHMEYHPLSELRAWAEAYGDRYPVPWREGGGGP